MVSLNPSILSKIFWIFLAANQKKRNTLCWERMWSLSNLIRNAKMFYLTDYFAFYRFLCGTYRKGLHWSNSKVRHSKYLKKHELCRYNTFFLDSHFSMFVYSFRYLKSLFDYAPNRSLFFWLNLITKKIKQQQQQQKWCATIITVFFYQWKIYLSIKQKFDVKQLNSKKYLKMFGKWLLVPQVLISTKVPLLQPWIMLMLMVMLN